MQVDIQLRRVLFLSVDGGFTDWTAWDTCSVTCGSGTQSRTRDCTNPAPAHGGTDCVGDIMESQTCDEIPCPSNTYLLILLFNYQKKYCATAKSSYQTMQLINFEFGKQSK